jgi:thioredoxin reductase
MAYQGDVYDAVIVGGGPAGLSAALMLGRCRRKVLVIDAGHPRNEAARAMHGFLGHDGIAPFELRKQGRDEAATYGVHFADGNVTHAEVVEADDCRHRTCFQVMTKGGQLSRCRKILFATGMCDDIPDFPGVRECYGATIHHCPYCDAWEHRDQRILVYGREIDDAIGLALALKCWSSHVTLLCNDQPMQADDIKRLERHEVAWAGEKIIRFVHQGDRLQGVELDRRVFLPADAMFFETGRRSTCDVPRLLGVGKRDSGSPTDRKQATNVPGIFIAGDADGDVQFAVVAAAEGATAAVAIHRQLQDEDQELIDCDGRSAAAHGAA